MCTECSMYTGVLFCYLGDCFFIFFRVGTMFSKVIIITGEALISLVLTMGD